jgi:predicted ester cyclase
MHLALQLGLDPHELARRLAAADRSTLPPPPAELTRAAGQHAPEPLPAALPDDVEGGLVAALHEIWNRRMLDTVRLAYAATAVLNAPVGRRLLGHDEITGLYLALLAALPDAVWTAEHTARVEEPGLGTSVAVRWRLRGTHDGAGPFGPPSGRRVAILGIGHYRLAQGRITEEWTVYDELAVLRQLHGQLG